MPHTTTIQEIKNFFGHIEKIQIIQDKIARNQTIDSVFGELLAHNPTKLESLYILFSKQPEDREYQELLIYSTFRVLLEQNGVAQEQATKLYSLFNKDINKIKKYLQDYAKQNLNSPEPMHDACNFAVPSQESEYTSKVWTDLSAKYLTEVPFRQLLAQAPEIETLIKTQAQAVPHANRPSKTEIADLTEEINSLNSSIKKQRSRASSLTEAEKVLLQKEADMLIAKKAQLTTIGVPFNNELSLTTLTAFREKYVLEASRSYKQFLENGLTKKDHDKFTKLARQDDDSIIPPLRIDGAILGYPGYYLMKVPVIDEAHAARAAYFGKLTNCCQSLSGEAGELCVIHGLTSPNGGFYVICHGDIQSPRVTDEVLGQSWVWRGKENALVFDSIETTPKDTGIYENKNKIVTDLVRAASKELIEGYDIDRILCGATSGISKEVGIIKAVILETFRDYSGYSDSIKQLILRDKHRPFYSFEVNPEGTEATIQWVTQKLENKVPLSDVTSLGEALNWALLSKNINLIKIMQDLANEKQINRLPEMNNLINLLEGYIKHGLTSDITDSIINNSFPVDAVNKSRATPLILAALSGNKNLILSLIQKRVDLEHVDISGSTALICAASSGHLECVKELIKARANLEHVVEYGETSLLKAALAGNSDCVRELIEAGANLEHVAISGRTPIMYAVKSGHLESIKELIKARANLDWVDNQGRTALMHAVGYQNLDGVRELIKAGANLEYADSYGTTVLEYAIKGGDKDIITAIENRLKAIESKKTNSPAALESEQNVTQVPETKSADIDSKERTLVIRYRRPGQ